MGKKKKRGMTTTPNEMMNDERWTMVRSYHPDGGAEGKKEQERKKNKYCEPRSAKINQGLFSSLLGAC
jgi:hypothetical protein